MEYIVEMEDINKKYGRFSVLNDISMNLEKGKIYGLLGENGAGKTTIIRIITGLTYSNSGSLKLFGSEDLGKKRNKIGVTIENPVLFEGLTALKNLKMYNTVCNRPEKELLNLLELVGLKQNRKVVKKYSLGMKQRLALAVSLLGNPEFIILDEPTNGLDPLAIRDLHNLILKLNKENGISFLISSHDVNELTKVADNFIIIKEGNVKCEFSKSKIKKMIGNSDVGMDEYLINLMEE